MSATAGDGSTQVTFAPPSSDNGAPVTGYTVTASTGQSASTPDGRTVATVTGLRNGTPVTFTVVAINAEGTGPASAPSSAVTPAAAAGTPAPPTATQPTGTSPTGTRPAPDTAATLRLTGLVSRTTLKRFLGGLRFAVTPSKAVALQITLSATTSGAVISRFNLTLASRSLRLAVGKRTVKLVPSRRLVGHPRTARVRLTVVAIDAAGTRSQITRTVRIKG